MPTKAGERLKFDTGSAEVVVTKGGDGTIEFDPSGAGALQVGQHAGFAGGQNHQTGVNACFEQAVQGEFAVSQM